MTPSKEKQNFESRDVSHQHVTHISNFVTRWLSHHRSSKVDSEYRGVLTRDLLK